MKTKLTLTALLLGCALGVQAASIFLGANAGKDTLTEAWENPPRDVRPGTRWQIQGNALRAEDTTAYIDAIHRQGFAGLEIMSYLPIYHEGNALWGTDDYFAMVRNIVGACKERGMWATLNFGPGWGLGNAWVPQYDGSKVLVFDELGEFSGGVDLTISSPNKPNAPYAQRNSKKLEALLAVKLENGGAGDSSVYSERFSGTAEAPLNGSAPQQRPGTETWSAHETLKSNGSFGSRATAASLPFTLEAGRVYSFETDVAITNPLSDGTKAAEYWAGISLRNSPTTANPAASGCFAGLLLRRNGQLVALAPGGDRSVQLNGTKTSMRLGLVLDATASNPADWTVTARSDGETVATLDLADTIDEGICYLSIGSFATTEGGFDHLTLSVGGNDDGQDRLVPEQVVDLSPGIEGDWRQWAVQPDYRCTATLPEGRWRLVAFWTALTGQSCAAGSRSVDASGNPAPERLVDHLDAAAVERFAETSFALFEPHIGEEFGKTVDCVFGDSFEIAQADFFWSDGFFEEFRKVKGYDLKPLLPQVIYGGTEHAPFLRHDFNHFLHLKGMEGIIGTMADVVEKRGMRMRQQPHYRFTTELMEASGRVKRAETEFNIRRFDPNIYPHKLTTSGVRLYGGDWVSCEAYTFAGPKYQITPTMVKASADGFLRDGVTQIIASVGYYQPEGYLEPFRDIMWQLVQVSPTMAWFDYFKPLNETIARSSAILRNSRFESDVLVYSPQATMWSERVHFPAKHIRDIPFGPLAKMLLAAGYDFDTVNDDLLIHRAKADDGALLIGDYDYRVLILPRALYLPVETLERIREFVASGGTCIALDTLPLGPSGMKNLDVKREQVAALVGELFAAGGGEKQVGKGRTVFLPQSKGFDYLTAWAPGSKDYEPTIVPDGWQDFIDTMHATLVPDVEFAELSQGLTFHRSQTGDREFFFLTNLSPNPVDEAVVLKSSGRPEEWDPMTGERAPFLEYAPTADGRTRAHIRLAPWHSTFLVVNRKAAPGLRAEESNFAAVRVGANGEPAAIATEPGSYSAKVVLPDGSARMVKADVTSLPSQDLSSGPWNIEFTGKLGDRKTMEWDGLRSWHEVEELKHFSGTGVYRQTFTLSGALAAKDTGRRVFLDLGTVHECASVSVNGKPAGDLWMAPYRIDVTHLLNPGKNEIEIRVVNLDWNFVKGHDEPTPIPAALQSHFGDNPMPIAGGQARVLPNLKRQFDFLPSGLIGPVRLATQQQVLIPAGP